MYVFYYYTYYYYTHQKMFNVYNNINYVYHRSFDQNRSITCIVLDEQVLPSPIERIFKFFLIN